MLITPMATDHKGNLYGEIAIMATINLSRRVENRKEEHYFGYLLIYKVDRFSLAGSLWSITLVDLGTLEEINKFYDESFSIAETQAKNWIDAEVAANNPTVG